MTLAPRSTSPSTGTGTVREALLKNAAQFLADAETVGYQVTVSQQGDKVVAEVGRGEGAERCEGSVVWVTGSRTVEHPFPGGPPQTVPTCRFSHAEMVVRGRHDLTRSDRQTRIALGLPRR